MSKKKFSENISGKGYYIALILCAVAIGISGYLYYRNAEEPEPQLQDPTEQNQQVNATVDPVINPDPTQPDTTTPGGNETPSPSGKPMKTVAPVEGQTVAEYAMDCLSYNQTTRDWRTHNGIDIAAEAGTAVCSAADGTVYTVYTDETMGTTVVIRHEGGYMTRYASLAEEVSVKPGDAVTMGQKIGCVGNTALLESGIGDHVHFAVTCNDATVDPLQFLEQE